MNKFILIRRERNEESFDMFNEILVDSWVSYISVYLN